MSKSGGGRVEKSRISRLFVALSIFLLAAIPLSSAYAANIVGVSIPVDSMDGFCHSTIDGVWSVSAPPFPLNINSGIGFLINPGFSLDPADFTLHDHVYVATHMPDPNRAVVTYQFDEAVVVDKIEVVQHRNGISQIEGFVGDSLGSLTSIGAVFGPSGDTTFPFYEGQRYVFDFDNARAGQFFQFVIRKTTLHDGYAMYRAYPTFVVSIATTSSLASNLNPSVAGQSVTFTATVSSAGGVPTGSVQFTDDGTSLGSAAVISGAATLTTSALAVGAHPITATYSGDGTYGSSVASLTQQVNASTGQATSTSLAVSPTPSVIGEAITLTATVSGALAGNNKPTGTVTFLDGTSVIATVTIAGTGKAVLTTAALAAGTHSLSARYDGSSAFDPSVSGSVLHKVGAAASIALLSTPNPSNTSQVVTFTATVTGGVEMPTGTVAFYDGTSLIGTASVDGSGVATLATSSLSAANHSITAVYGGDSVYAGVTSAVLRQNVKTPKK